PRQDETVEEAREGRRFRPEVLRALAINARRAVVLGLLAGAFFVGYGRPAPPSEPPAAPAASAGPGPGAVTPTAAPAPEPSAAPVARVEPAGPADAPAVLLEGESRPFLGAWWVLLPLLGLAGLVAWRSSLQAQVVVRDSTAFEKALTVWGPVIGLRARTPRALKRFVNRVRYYAMRQRTSETPPHGLAWVAAEWERRKAAAKAAPAVPEKIRAWVWPDARPPATENSALHAIQDGTLVALCAVRNLGMTEEFDFRDLSLERFEQASGLEGTRKEALVEAAKAHVAEDQDPETVNTLGPLALTDEQLARFQAIAGGIDFH
ncbi:MAG TPA: hypothetical protein VK610_00980, partial [Rhodothermales bacterium]|nr:hypothetical protein [Rhodothermales bacterium]